MGPPVRRHLPNQGGGGAREARRRARGRLRFLVRLPGRQRGRLRRRARQYRRRQPPRLARRRAAHPSQRRVLPSKQLRRRRAVRVPEATRRAGHAISATRRRTRPARHAFPSRRAGPKYPERRAKRPQASRRRRDERIARIGFERPSRTRSRRSVGEKRRARARARVRARSRRRSRSFGRVRSIRRFRAIVAPRSSRDAPFPRGIPSTETFVGVEPRGRRRGRRERRRRERGRVRDDGGVVRDGRILGRVVRSKRREREEREAFARGGGGESRENRRGARGRRRRRRYPRRERVHRGRGCGLAPGIPRARRRHETTIPRVEERSVGGRSRNRSVRGWRRAFGAAGDESGRNRNRNRNRNRCLRSKFPLLGPGRRSGSGRGRGSRRARTRRDARQRTKRSFARLRRRGERVGTVGERCARDDPDDPEDPGDSGVVCDFDVDVDGWNDVPRDGAIDGGFGKGGGAEHAPRVRRRRGPFPPARGGGVLRGLGRGRRRGGGFEPHRGGSRRKGQDERRRDIQTPASAADGGGG